MSLRTGIFFLAIMAVLALPAKGQDLNRYFLENTSLDAAGPGKLSFAFDNSNFIKDDEYFGKLQNGFTYIGFFARPALVYRPHRDMKITAGFQFLKYSGLESFANIRPVFQFQYSPVPQVSLVFGTLYGNLNHRLVEQLYNFNNYFDKNLEEGLQILLDYPRINLDLWLNWGHFIYREEAEQERIIGGYHLAIPLFGGQKTSPLLVDLQGLVQHQGGQYHSSGLVMQTLFNSASGFKWFCFQGSDVHPHNLGINAYFLGYQDLSPVNQLAYQSGRAYSGNVFYGYKLLKLSAGYWRGNRFVPFLGNPLFSSISVDYPGFYQPQSELITGKLSLGKKLYDDVSLEFRYEGYWDLKQKILEHSFGLYLIFKGEFFLKKFE